MSLALFPNMGSSASVAVTWATVVPVGEGGLDHKVRVSSGSSSSRRGNKAIILESRRVCLSGSGRERGGGLKQREKRDVD